MKKNVTAEKKFTNIAMGLALKPNTVSKPDKPIIILKRIGSTTYEVAVHFSETSKETVSDKIKRLIKNETEARKGG